MHCLPRTSFGGFFALSIKVMTKVWDMSLPPVAKLLLLKLADYGDDEGCNVFPSITTLADKTGISRRTVQRTLRVLEEQNLLEVETPATRYAPTRYRINIWNLRGDTVTPLRGDKRRAPGVTNGTSRGDTVTPNPLEEPLEEPRISEKDRKENLQRLREMTRAIGNRP